MIVSRGDIPVSGGDWRTVRGKTPLTFAFFKTGKVEFLAIGTGRNLRIFRRESAPISFLKHQKGNGRGRSKEKMFGANSASKMPLCESTGVFRMSSDTDAGGLLPGALYRLLG